jgi:hypothetical protein
LESKSKKGNIYRFDKAKIEELRKEFASLSLDERDDELFDSNECEAVHALHLIRSGFVDTNIFSSPDWIQEIAERFKSIENTPSMLLSLVEILPALGYELTPLESYPPESNFTAQIAMTEAMEHLQNQWNTLDKFSDEDFDWRACENHIPNYRNLTTVQAFVSAVMAGGYPTPELMLSLAKSFELYFTAAGELSLEEVLFGRPRKRAGIFASRSIRELRFLFFHDTVEREKARASDSATFDFSLEDLADRFLRDENMDDDGNVGYFDNDTFLRGYRRWKSKNIDLDVLED